MAANDSDCSGENKNYGCDQASAVGNVSDSFLLLSYLDEVGDRVEALRRHASALSQEKLSLLTIISQLKDEIHISKTANETQSRTGAITEGESQEMMLNIEQLCQRCKSVDIKVHSVRSKEQQCALEKVDSMVRELELMMVLDSPPVSSLHTRAETYLNACLSDSPINSAGIDYRFQGMILDCTMDDQKSIRRRLESLVQGRCHVDFLEDKSHREGKTVSQNPSENSQSDTATKLGPDSVASNGVHSDLENPPSASSKRSLVA